MPSRLLKTTVLAVAAGAMWTRMPRVTLRWNSRWRLSLKCWFMGHEGWIRGTPERLYLECFECGRETQRWTTGKRQAEPSSTAGRDLPAIKHEDQSSPRLVPSRKRQSLSLRNAGHGDATLAA